MADNIIKVNVTANKSQRVTVSSANVGTEITASSDTGKFWAQTSKNWAVSENIVDGEDYSSKYYANKSKGYAQNAENFEAAARETYNSFVSDASSYIEELTDLKDAGAVEINEAVANGKDEINSAKTTILNDIEFVADGEKKEIEDLADLIKENVGEVLEAVSQVKADKLDKSAVKAYITETYVNGKSWYRIYSDGWCEQGGVGWMTVQVTFIKPYRDNNYQVFTQMGTDGVVQTYYNQVVYQKKNTSFTTNIYQGNSSYGFSWHACGYIS